MVYIAFALTCFAGCLLLPPGPKFGPLPRLGLAFGLGAFAISLQMFAAERLGISWTRWSLVLPWCAAAVMLWFRSRERFALPALRLPDRWEIAFSLLLLGPVLVWLPWERVMPLTSQSWDAWAIWLFKAKAFYLDGGIGAYLERGEEFANHPGYPLLVPLYATFLYVWQGEAAADAAKLLSPCFLFATWGVFHGFARREGGPLTAMAFTAMLATLPMVNVVAFALAGYADTALSLYLLAAAGFVYNWYRANETADLAGASIAATAAAWTKNEGLFFLAGVALLVGLRLLRGGFGWRCWAWLLTPPVLVLLPWALVRRAYGLEAAGFVPGASFDLHLFWTALGTLLAKTVEPQLFSLTFFVMLASLAAAFRLRLAAAFWTLPALVFWHLGGALLAYSTGRNDLAWWLGTSADRILAQIAPVALLCGAVVFGHWMSAAEEAAPAGSRPEDTLAVKQPRRKAGKRRS